MGKRVLRLYRERTRDGVDEPGILWRANVADVEEGEHAEGRPTRANMVAAAAEALTWAAFTSENDGDDEPSDVTTDDSDRA